LDKKKEGKAEKKKKGMVKISSIARSTEANTRERSGDRFAVRRNPDPALHPFERAREYARALNATKLDRMFAKPFVANLEGHRDGIYALATDPHSLHTVISGSADGDLRVWDLRKLKCVSVAEKAHTAFIRAVTMAPMAPGLFLSGSDDHFIKMWRRDAAQNAVELQMTFETEQVVHCLDHHRKEAYFLSAGGAGVLEWHHDRSEPTNSFRFTANDSYSALRINPSQGDLFVAAGTSDRSIVIGDRRMAMPVTKNILATRTNALAWNPMTPFTFAAANDDRKTFAFDMRKLNHPQSIYVDHVAAVMSVDYSPTGQHLVTGSYDKTLRIFDAQAPMITVHSSDVYHTMRMQRIWSVRYTSDSAYILSGSDDGNVRLWKAQASQPLGPLSSREAAALAYRQKLTERFSEMPEIKRISRHRHLPKEIKSRARTERIHVHSQKQKAERRIKHSKSSEAMPNPRDDIVIQKQQ
jgi:WD repeat and SOF domain-containing protein 1